MPAQEAFLQVLGSLLAGEGTSLYGWTLAWARVAPSVALVPAFGLRAVPPPVRVALGLALAAAAAPALTPLADDGRPWPLALMIESANGLPIAVSAATALWTASMVGGLVDNLRGSREQLAMPTAEPETTPLGVLFGLLVAIVFLESGGAARIATLVTSRELQFGSLLLRTLTHLTHGVELAVLVAAPLLAASVVLDVAGALITRAASPAYVQQVVAPLRALMLLAATALLLDRMLALLNVSARHLP
jgi:flagellar biosynthesis protein FliR